MTYSYNAIISQKNKNRNPVVSELRVEPKFVFEPYSVRAVKSFWISGAMHPSRARHEARGATVAASLTSELADSALLGYLRRRSF